MRILVVEDEQKLAGVLKRGLEEHGFAVDVAYDGEDGLALATVAPYDLLVLDIMLPNLDGLRLCQKLRAQNVHMPVLMLTARDAVDDRVAGLDSGADDYLTKPFAFRELLARIRALLRRSAGRGEPVYSHKGVTLDPATRQATVHGEPVRLSAREWAVLEPMLARPGVVFSRAQLEEKLYGWKDEVSSNAVEVYVHGLRKKLGAELIQTVRGLGYVVPRE
jgi:two-component system OmpR family response regulator